MNGRDIINTWLGQFGMVAGAALELEETGICSIAFTDDMTVSIEVPEPDDKVYVYADLCPMPAENREAKLERALALNLFLYQTDGTTVALDSARDMLTLCILARIQQLDEASFAALLESFLGVAGRLRRELLPSDVPPPAADIAGGIRI